MLTRVTLYLLIALSISFYTPVMAKENTISDQPNKPYEKLIAKNGSWYTQQIDGSLIVKYDGNYSVDDSILNQGIPSMTFNVKKKTVLTGLYLPYASSVDNALKVTLKDSQHNIYGPFNLQSGTLSAGNINYFVFPDQSVVLEKSSYEMALSYAKKQVRTTKTGDEGAYLLKGIDYEAN